MHLYIHKYYLCRHLVPPMPGGVLPAACELMDEVACFSFFMTDSIVDTMLENTNKSIENFKGQLGPDDLETIRTKAPYIKTTTALELKAFMGLLILRGVYKCNYTAVRKFWNSHPVFPATMSINRFQFLHRYVSMFASICIHFCIDMYAFVVFLIHTYISKYCKNHSKY